jgi:hypothetical protein
VLGLSLVKKTIQKIKENTNPELEILGILATMFERKTSHSREVLELIDKEFPDEVFDTIISRTVRFSESTVAGVPVTAYASSSSGSVTADAPGISPDLRQPHPQTMFVYVAPKARGSIRTQPHVAHLPRRNRAPAV